jgi:polysaccharide biosynthesis transport protein
VSQTVDYARILRNHYRLLIALTVLGAVLGYSAAALQEPSYTGVNSVFVSTRAGSSATDLSQGAGFAQGRVASYSELVTSREVLDPVASDLDAEVEELLGAVSASTDPETVIIDIEASSSDPETAATIANAVAEEFADVVSELELPNSQGQSSVSVSTVSEATPPSAPSSPNTILWTIGGALLAMFGCWLVLIVRSLWSTKVRTREEVESITDAPILGTIQKVSRVGNIAQATVASPSSAIAESYRQIRTNLRFLAVDRRVACIAVTSALPGEGKSTVASNLAESLCEGDESVLLIDADLRRPSIGSYLDVESAVGLSSVLAGEVSVDLAIQRPAHTPNLAILPSGPIPPNPSELVASAALSELLETLGADWDRVVIDTPPVMAVADGILLAEHADVALLVVRQGYPKHGQLRDAAAKLRQLPSTPSAVVFNAVSGGGSSGDYSYYEAYSAPVPTSG